ncbi:asparagine synthetase B, partial [bacterium]
IDKELVEFAMSIKGEYKIRGAVSKYILKDVASNYLPKRIVHRPKVSFGMPIRAWVSDELRDYIDDVLSFENIKKRGIFDPQYVRQIIREDRQGKADNAYRIYQFLTLELWFRRYIDHETITAKF